MVSMMRRYALPSRFASSPLRKTVNLQTRRPCCTLFFSWLNQVPKVLMQICRSGSVLFLVLSCVLGLEAQDSPSAAAPPAASITDASVEAAQSAAPLPPAAITLNDVLDHVVQREHLFMAQMRHMH